MKLQQIHHCLWSEGLDLYGGLGILNTKVQNWSEDPTAIGADLPYAPKSQLNLGAQYRLPVTDDGDLVARVDMYRTGNQTFFPSLNSFRTIRAAFSQALAFG